LVPATKANPGATIGALAEAIGKSRTSTVTALHRLRDADLAGSQSGVWSLVEPPTPEETARWIDPSPPRAALARKSVRTPESGPP
jgi:hypothetical protein